MAVLTLNAGDDFVRGNTVFVNSSGVAYLANADNAGTARILGLAVNSVSIGGQVQVETDSAFALSNSFEPGELIYSSIVSGQITNYETLISGLSTTTIPSLSVSKVGVSLDSESIAIEKSNPVVLGNPTALLLLETQTGITITDTLLLENGDTISLESATV